MIEDDCKCSRVILRQDDGNTLQNDHDRLLDWTKTWAMEFNFCKSQVLRLTMKKVPFVRGYFLVDCKLNRVIFEKDLRILISHNLNKLE